MNERLEIVYSAICDTLANTPNLEPTLDVIISLMEFLQRETRAQEKSRTRTEMLLVINIELARLRKLL